MFAVQLLPLEDESGEADAAALLGAEKTAAATVEGGSGRHRCGGGREGRLGAQWAHFYMVGPAGALAKNSVLRGTQNSCFPPSGGGLACGFSRLREGSLGQKRVD